MQLGKFVYDHVFKPTAGIRYKYDHFGLRGWYNYNKGENEMRNKASYLSPVKLITDENVLKLNYLTGKNYWHQTIFCIQSLVRHFGNNLLVNIYSDGTLTQAHNQIFKAYCPQLNLINEEEILENLNTILPVNKYPTLNFLRNWHPFYKRLIDIHCKLEWNIHLDSDMIFFKKPESLIELSNNKLAFYMQEQQGQSFFSDSPELLLKTLQIPTLASVNGGIIAFDGNKIDFDDFEYKSKVLLERYFNKGPGPMEQTLMSYILHTQSGIPLNNKDYKIYYDCKINHFDEATLRHYIFKAKLPYFTEEWKSIIR